VRISADKTGTPTEGYVYIICAMATGYDEAANIVGKREEVIISIKT
jgi:hypothetical protein